MKRSFRISRSRLRPGVCAAAALVAAAPAAARDMHFDPLTAYGKDIVFDVYRAGERIGEHRVTFGRTGDALTAESRFSIRITILGLPLYRYEYSSVGIWRDGQLARLNARVDDDGTVSTVDAERNAGKLKVHSDDVHSVAPDNVYPTTHWNPGVIGTAQVLNTITGRINSVRMQEVGTENVVTGGTHRLARRFVYTGELETEVWYDMVGRWVKMRFNGKDGTPIEYVCRRCGENTVHNSEGAQTTAPGTL